VRRTTITNFDVCVRRPPGKPGPIATGRHAIVKRNEEDRGGSGMPRGNRRLYKYKQRFLIFECHYSEAFDFGEIV